MSESINRNNQQMRFEDMSPEGCLSLFRQEDGDIIITVREDQQERGRTTATVEFTTPMSGGGQSQETWRALLNLFEAMKRDNEQRIQQRGN